MKSSRYTFFTSLLCASGLSGGLCFCIITSFSVPADRLLLACACVLAALFFSALLLLPKSWIWLLAVAALAGGGLYMLRAQLIESASVLVSAVTQQYSEAIPGIQVIQLTDAADADATLIFILIAALYALLCSWTVMRSQTEEHSISEIEHRRTVQPVRVDTRVEDLLSVAAEQNFVPVIDDKGDFIGIVTRSRILRYYLQTNFLHE